MEHVAEQDRFSETVTAAPSIFSYVKANPALKGHPLEFEYGMVDRISGRAVAKFSCRSCATCRNAVVWISALTELDGSWALSHTVGALD